MSGRLVFVLFFFLLSSVASTQYLSIFSDMKRIKDLYHVLTKLFGIKKRLTLMLNLSFNYFYLKLIVLLFNTCKTVLEKMSTDFQKEYNAIFK